MSHFKDGYLMHGRVRDHVAVAEKILGKKLPIGAEVHHWDGNKLNNVPSNLVVCPSHEYHMLLHRRQAALEACGNANWLKCRHCCQYDDPKNLSVGYLEKYKQYRIYHKACANDYNKAVIARKKSREGLD